MGQTGCPETLVTDYKSMPRNIPEEQMPQVHRDGNLRSRPILWLCFVKEVSYNCGVVVYREVRPASGNSVIVNHLNLSGNYMYHEL
jgi:hypothetical protein